ncbi:MAG: histidine phosphatase family protein, partial [Candidatus Limnocylindrales bacterium]
MGHLSLVRHSTTRASAGGRNLGQRFDPPLADAGVALARRLGTALEAELAQLPVAELRLVSSPTRRCRETVAAIV